VKSDGTVKILTLSLQTQGNKFIRKLGRSLHSTFPNT